MTTKRSREDPRQFSNWSRSSRPQSIRDRREGSSKVVVQLVWFSSMSIIAKNDRHDATARRWSVKRIRQKSSRSNRARGTGRMPEKVNPQISFCWSYKCTERLLSRKAAHKSLSHIRKTAPCFSSLSIPAHLLPFRIVVFVVTIHAFSLRKFLFTVYFQTILIRRCDQVYIAIFILTARTILHIIRFYNNWIGIR